MQVQVYEGDQEEKGSVIPLGTYYELYTEATIDGKPVNLDFLQRPPGGEPQLVPLIEGKSAVGSALRWHGLGQPIDWENLSPELQEKFPKKETSDPFSRYYFEYFPATWFDGKNLNLPEFSGFVLRQTIHDFESGEVESISGEGFLSPDEYNELEPETRVAYRYYEWTEPWGIRDVMRRIETALNARVFAFNWSTRFETDRLIWGDAPQEVSRDQIKVIVHMS